MKIAAGLRAPEGKLARLLRHNLNLRDFVPVGLKLALIILPGDLLVYDTLLLDDGLHRMAVQEKSVGHIERGWFQ